MNSTGGFVVTVAILIVVLTIAAHLPEPKWMRQPNGQPGPPRTRRRGDHGPRTLHLFAVRGCTDCALASPPPCDEHGARELAGMPPYHPEQTTCPIPDGDRLHELAPELWPDGWQHLLDQPDGETNPPSKGSSA